MIDSDDAKRLSAREDVLADEVRRRDSDPSLGAPTLLALTTTLRAYPATPQSYYACVAVTLLGAETEGGPGTTTAVGTPFFALNLGSTVPPTGTMVLATFAGNRWVFRYDA